MNGTLFFPNCVARFSNSNKTGQKLIGESGIHEVLIYFTFKNDLQKLELSSGTGFCVSTILLLLTFLDAGTKTAFINKEKSLKIFQRVICFEWPNMLRLFFYTDKTVFQRKAIKKFVMHLTSTL